MIQGFYTASMGSKSQQQRLDTIADNVANVNTTGFKSSRMDFKDAMYSTMKKQVEGQDGNLELGHGVLVSATKRYFNTGSLQTTGDALDFAIQGDGFFTVAGSDGQRHYTRNGAFVLTEEATGNYLANGNGEYVLDVNGNRIAIPAGIKAEELGVRTDGTLHVNGEPIAQMNIAAFDNNDGLSAVGSTSFVPTDASGPARRAENPGVINQTIEASNVDMSTELTDMIRTQRAFQLAGRGITTCDEMESIANNMRR